MPTKRIRIGKMLPSEKAVVTELAKGEEAFEITEGKAVLMEEGRRVTQPKVVIEVPISTI